MTDAPVGKRRDDESLGAAEELVLILEVDVSDADETLVDVIEEVETRLLRPLKVRRRLDRQLTLKFKQHAFVPKYANVHVWRFT